MYGEYFGGMLRGTSFSSKLETLRPVGDDHALADLEQTVVDGEGNVVLVVHVAALFRRDGDGGEWRFADARPYTFAEIPG